MASGRTSEMTGRIIAAIVDKLQANRSTLDKSKSGRVIWRIDRDGNVEVFLEPKI